MLEAGLIKREELERIAKQARDDVDAAVEFARKSPLPDAAEASEDLWI